MNKVILIGRLTADPDVKYTQSDNPMCIARYTLAIDRPKNRQSDEQPAADFPRIVAFGGSGEFAEKYLRKGMKILVEGHIQTGSYTNKDGQKVYTTEVSVDRHEFVESKNSSDKIQSAAPAPADGAASDSGDGFMNIPDGIDEELPFM